MKRNVFKGLQTLICCVVLLLGCSTAALAAGSGTLDISACLNGQSMNNIVSDLKNLPTALADGTSITWQALDSATLATSKVMTAQGKVTRPAYGEADAAVILRATGEEYTQDFYLIVAAMGAEEARMVITRNEDNADFEAEAPEDEFTAPDGWLKSMKWEDGPSRMETSYAKIVTDRVYSGKQALRLTSGGQRAIKRGETTVEDILNSVQNSAVTTAREGFTYTLDVMAYSNSGATEAFVALKFWDNEGLEITKPYTVTYTSTSGYGVWKNLHISAVAPAGTVMVTAELDAGAADGYVTYFDDVRLREWPIVANGDFDLGTTGWTTDGAVSNGELTLTSGQTAVSVVRGANRGVAYYLSLEATGGTAALRFVDANGGELETYKKAMTSGLNAFFAYAPADTAGVQVVLTGAMTADNVKITRSATGTAVADGDFEFSANAGMGSPWDLSNATTAGSTGQSNTAGLTVTSDYGNAKSNVFPLEDGKNYVFSADVKGTSGKMEIVLYNVYNGSTKKDTVSVSSKSSSWNPISYSFDPLNELSDSDIPEHFYAQIVLSGRNATFDNVKVYSTSKNVSNASMENTKIIPYGTFPFNWSGYGSAATYVANQDGQYTEGVKSLAVELFGLGEGGIRSSMIENVESGAKYEATIKAMGYGASLNIEFWSESFSKLHTKSVTIASEDWEKYSVTDIAPEGAAYASLSVGGNGVGLVYADEATLYPAVRSIDNNVQLFLDDWLIAQSQNVDRTFYEGEKGPRTTLLGGYPSIQWDEKEQKYKAWYRSGKYMRYSTSEDGITWIGSTVCYVAGKTDQVLGGYVHIDDSESDLSKRYKAIIWNGKQSRVTGSYDYYSSADGINWTFEAKGIPGQDVHTMVYDPVNNEYLLTYKNSMVSPYNVQTKRVQNIAVSKDLMNWTTGVRMYTVGTPMDTVEEDMFRTDGYGNGMYALGDSYVGLNWRTLLNEAESFGGVLDSNMLFSRDLTEDWQRLRDKDGTAALAIPLGEPGTEDSGQIYTAGGPIQVGNQTRWYYYAESGEHGYTQVSNKYGAYAAYAVWRKNGFGSLDFGTNATMTTQQFILTSESLRLNAVGTLNVALLDENGDVLATAVFSGDSVDEELVWSDSVASSLGQPVSLRFTGSDAKLYSLQQSSSITLLPAQNGTAVLKTTSAAAGSKLTVEVTPDEGYMFERLVVNGQDLWGVSTFTVPNGGDVTVRAVFVPEFNLFYEDMEDYTAGKGLPLESGESFAKRAESTGEYSAQVVTEGSNQVLKMTATDNSDTDYNRIWLTTNEKFSGQYTVQVKIKAEAGSLFSSVRLPGVDLPRYNTKTSEYTTGDYDLRFKDGEIWIHLDRVTAANAWTGGNAKETVDSTSHLGLYTTGTADGTRVGFTKDTWYTVKIHVDDSSGIVLTELYDKDDVLLGSRTLSGATIEDTAVTLDHYATKSNTGNVAAVYFDEVAVVRDDIATYTVTLAQRVNGTISVDKEIEKEGRTITVTATPDDGYVLHAIYVNGKTISGNTFILTDDVTVTATFKPEDARFYEDFERYTVGDDYEYAAGDTQLNAHDIRGDAEFVIAETDDGAQALKVSVTGAATGFNRSWLKTNQSFSGSYLIEARFKNDGEGAMTYFRLPGIDVSGDYQLRFTPSAGAYIFETDKTDNVNKTYTVANAATAPEGQWYIVKIYVNDVNGDGTNATVITELWSGDGTSKLGGYTYDGVATITTDIVGFETQSKAGVTRDTYWDYLAVKENSFSVTTDTCVNGSVEVSSTEAAYGTEITVTATPNDGYVLHAIYVNGEALSGNTFTLTKDTTITATFKDREQYTAKIGDHHGGTLKLNGALTDVVKPSGEIVTVTAEPESGYTLNGIYVNGTKLEATDGAYSFAMPEINDENGDPVDTIVAADFQPENALFNEGFVGYKSGTDLTFGGSFSGSNIKDQNCSGTYTLTAATEDGTSVMHVNTASGRAHLRTGIGFSSDHTVKVRMKVAQGHNSNAIDFRYMNIKTGGSQNLIFRLNANTGALTYAKGSGMNGVVKDAAGSAAKYEVGTWINVRIDVIKSKMQAVATFTKDDGTLIGQATTTFETFAACGFTFDSGSGKTGDIYYDYIVITPYECSHTNKTALGEAQAATCTSTGLTAGEKCADCGETLTEQEVISATGHSHKSVVTAPTCTAAGYTTYTCSACGDSYTGNEVSALDHDWDEGEITTPPTVQAEGVKTFTCQREGCGATRTEPVDKLTVYTVTVDSEIVGGTVSVNPAAGEAGATVTVTATPDVNYELVTIYVNGVAVVGNPYTFVIEGDTVVTATFEEEEIVVPAFTGTLNPKSMSAAFEDLIFLQIAAVASDFSVPVDEDSFGLLVWTEDTYPGIENAVYDEAYAVHGSTYNASNGRYTVRSYGVPAPQLGDTLYMLVYATDGNGNYVYATKTGTTDKYVVEKTLAEYALKQIGTGFEDTAVAMLNYGAAAQVYFDYNDETLMNTNLTDAQKALVWDESMISTDVTSVNGEQAGKFVRGANVTRSIAVELEAAINMQFTFTFTTNQEIVNNGVLFWSGETVASGVTLTEENAIAERCGEMEFISKSGSASKFVANYDGIAAAQMDQAAYACGYVELADGTIIYSGIVGRSPRGYACNQITKAGNSAELVEWMKRMVIYGDAAKAYFLG